MVRNRENKGFQLRLGLSHAVVLLGIVLGSLAASFFLGYRSGKMERFDEMAAQSLDQLPRLPISTEDQPQEMPERLVSDVYQKLQGEGVSSEPAIKTPELEPVKVLPIPSDDEETLDDLAKGEARRTPKKRDAQAAKSRENLKHVKDEKPTTDAAKDKKDEQKGSQAQVAEQKSSNETLGGLFELGNAPPDPKKVEVKPTPREEKQQTAKSGVLTNPSPVEPKVDKEKKPREVPSGWYVQLAAFETSAEAEQLRSTLDQNGFRNARIQNARVQGKQYFRVLVGPEESTLLAKRLREQLIREPYIKFKPYLKRIQ